MTYFEIVMLAFALSVDATVVSFSYGLLFKENRFKNSFLLALFTGVFQGLMPVLGYYLTGFVKSFIEPYAHIIIFLIFTYLGIKFILEAYENKEKNLCLGFVCLFMIGVATSVDAFSAGISLALFGNRILKPAILITVITFLNSILGFVLGGHLQKFPSKMLEISSGVILILLGIKSLF